MKYTKRRKYKYTVAESVMVRLPSMTTRERAAIAQMQKDNGELRHLQGRVPIVSHLVFLDLDRSELTVYNDYAWDGVSAGFNTKTNKRASLAHDALYQLMREGLLPVELKDWADRSFRQICIEDGMCEFRANYSYQAVKRFGAKHCDPANHILTAP